MVRCKEIKPSNIAGGTLISATTLENSVAVPQMLDIALPDDLQTHSSIYTNKNMSTSKLVCIEYISATAKKGHNPTSNNC